MQSALSMVWMLCECQLLQSSINTFKDSLRKKKSQLKFAFFETRAQFYPMTMDASDHRSNLVSIRSSMVLLSTNNITPASFL